MALYLGNQKVSINSATHYYGATSVFYTDQKEVIIRLKGTGEITIVCDNNEQTKNLNENEYTEIKFIHNTKVIRTYKIKNIKNITELDLSNNGITKLIFTQSNNITKLILNNNNLNHLDCSHFDNIQFLHMFNNPMCDNESLMKKCVETLPDRKDKAMGSIVFYPWYGLETLIEEVNGKYYKYPHTNIPSDIKGNPNSEELTIVSTSTKLYGVVKNNQIVEYRKGLAPYVAMNKHHSIRKSLEENSLPKNWLFGSAILYAEPDNPACSWNFKRSNIADMWETAEKGFGLTIGSFDAFAGEIDAWEDLNILGFIGSDGEAGRRAHTEAKSETNRYQYYINNFWDHGDATASLYCGRGGNSVYGISPNAQILIFDAVKPTDPPDLENGSLSVTGSAYWVNQLSILTKYADIASFAIIPYFPSEDTNTPSIRKLIGEFGRFKGLFNLSSNNKGDSDDFTAETITDLPYGNYIDDNGNTQISGVICNNNCFSNSYTNGCSNTVPNTSKMSLRREDKMSAFGSGIVTWANYGKNRQGGSGTSYATPIAAGIFALMLNIYKKLFPHEIQFGKETNFYTHIVQNWMYRFESENDYSDGIGIPNMFHPNELYQALPADCDINISTNINGYKVGKCFRLGYEAESLNCKQDYTIDDVADDDFLNLDFISTRNNYICFNKSGNFSLSLMNNSNSVDNQPIKSTVPVNIQNHSNRVLNVSTINEIGQEFTVSLVRKLNSECNTLKTGTNNFNVFFAFSDATDEIRCGISHKSTRFGMVTSNPSKYSSFHSIPSIYTKAFNNVTYNDSNNPIYAVITLVKNKTDLEIFINGHFILSAAHNNEDILNINNLLCYSDDANTLETNSKKIFMYNRVLVDEEIAENSVAILQNLYE